MAKKWITEITLIGNSKFTDGDVPAGWNVVDKTHRRVEKLTDSDGTEHTVTVKA